MDVWNSLPDICTLNDWTSALDQGLPTDVIYFDFSKAFDSVPHSRLLSKLKGYGVDGQLLEWFRCFLLTGTNVSMLMDFCHHGQE